VRLGRRHHRSCRQIKQVMDKLIRMLGLNAECSNGIGREVAKV
jgi:hypothetical protein